MAENLNCYVLGSKCYDNDPANCAKYGRFYDWSTAMALPSKCSNASCANRINAHHRGVCPANWHIPSNKEWDALYSFAGDTIAEFGPQENPTAGRRLKSAEGWFNCGSGKAYLCEDSFGFSAKPSGIGNTEGFFSNVGSYGFWWSINEFNNLDAYARSLIYNDDNATWLTRDKNYLFNVRCVRD